MSDVFVLRAVSFAINDRNILRDIDLEIARGQITSIVGPSGSGKTSLIRLLNRLSDPTHGTITLDGTPIDSVPVRSLRQRVGFVFQTPVMFAGTVGDNVREGATLAHRACPADRLHALLDSVGLNAEYADRVAGDLSGGERQRVSIARALATEPSVLLMDEPTSALDREVAARLTSTIAELSEKSGVTVVMVTHRLGEAKRMGGNTVVLDEGRIIDAGPTRRVFSTPATERARTYLLGDE